MQGPQRFLCRCRDRRAGGEESPIGRQVGRTVDAGPLAAEDVRPGGVHLPARSPFPSGCRLAGGATETAVGSPRCLPGKRGNPVLQESTGMMPKVPVTPHLDRVGCDPAPHRTAPSPSPASLPPAHISFCSALPLSGGRGGPPSTCRVGQPLRAVLSRAPLG